MQAHSNLETAAIPMSRVRNLFILSVVGYFQDFKVNKMT